MGGGGGRPCGWGEKEVGPVDGGRRRIGPCGWGEKEVGPVDGGRRIGSCGWGEREYCAWVGGGWGGGEVGPRYILIVSCRCHQDS